MVDCPHVEACGRLARLPALFPSTKPVERDDDDGGGGGGGNGDVGGDGGAMRNDGGGETASDDACDGETVISWRCEECATEESPWICVFCGVVGCGRYVNAHAKKHFEGL